ncbi:unnamed protein product [Peronospora belbahrii]|uniref:FHA domain-containing protein n=1 Tax=Peronospora belbahrii TaxID=622444 RepID=A0ABN8CJJ0_9STRA|nr:unnamed protein product [Peronospora belbahrii]
MKIPSAVTGCRAHKRALEDDDEHHTSRYTTFGNENECQRLLDVQVGLSMDAGSLPGLQGASGKRRHGMEAVKSRRLNVDTNESREEIGIQLSAQLDSISPALRVSTSDIDAARSPSHTGHTVSLISSLEMKKETDEQERCKLTHGEARSPSRPMIPMPLGTRGLVLENKTSPLVYRRKLDEEAAGRRGETDTLLAENQEQKRLFLHGKRMEDHVLGARGLPTISHLLEAHGQESSMKLEVASLNTPCQVSTVASTTMSSFKQGTTTKPYPSYARRDLETAKRVRTPVSSLAEILNVSNAPLPSFGTGDVSSDEELIGIPGADVVDLEVSLSQDKLEELSVTETSLDDETIVLTLCDGLANSLTKGERDQMERDNVFTIALAKQHSPIVFGREQFQNVFGDNIRGVSLSLLSRRHCLVHVENELSRDSATSRVKVQIENTSTNGSWVNGMQLKNGETYELELGDMITLLRIHRDENDVSLEYKLVRSGPSLDRSTTNTDKMVRRNPDCIDRTGADRHQGRRAIPPEQAICIV